MAEFLVLLHETPSTFSTLSASEMQAIVERYSAWTRGLAEKGRLVAGKKLTDDGGRHLRRERGAMVASDGPYAETKDVVGGLFIITAESYEDAATVLQDCPHFEYGWIEVRAVDVVA